MSIRLSTGLRNKTLESGFKPALDNGFLFIYPGSQPTNPDAAASGTLLGKVSASADDVTGLTFQVPAVLGVLSKTADELWQFIGLVDGQAGWFRFAEAGDNPASPSSTAARLDGTIGTAGADVDIGNSNIKTGAVNTVDRFTVTLPGA
jgi:hypothetical protein